MLVTAKLSYLRISPRKARLVAGLVRGKSVEQAQNILNFTVKRAASPVLKLLNSAAANAKNNFHLEAKDMYIAKIIVNGGPTYKRIRARSRGNANQIQKKTCHIEICLAGKKEKTAILGKEPKGREEEAVKAKESRSKKEKTVKKQEKKPIKETRKKIAKPSAAKKIFNNKKTTKK
ncbi:MAG: 50S ribosomal protein L22 [Candidatus Paceibacterota bacterium]|jgi:large subunit ribosomal protein L22|nr:50S ribosomal protein L22 [Candidatus Paceibacterota bacterium]MDD4830786.1 50S ribosomal protein L22 [Candidatus Paceibacterota bacterium]MDD4875292.1 50S ribosomal protein L22 [Candidatus Paceibacterota bacterium]